MEYFKVTNPLPSVYRLEDPRGVFLTLLVGKERAFLSDTGMGVGNPEKAVREITTLPLIVANTHGHIDHAGGNYRFPQVWMNRCDWPTAQEMAHSQSITMRIADLPIHQPPPGDFDRQAFLQGLPANSLNALEHNTHFDLGGLTITAISVPSHTPGSMAFLCHELKLLLTGDCIAPIVYLVFPESCSIKEHIRILREAMALSFERFLSSHQPELLPKCEIEDYIQCAQAACLEASFPFRNPMFPEYHSQMFVWRSDKRSGKDSVLVYTPDKFSLNIEP